MSNTKLQKQIINMYSNMYSLFDLNSFIPKTGTLRTCDSSQRSGGIRFVEDSWRDGHGFIGVLVLGALVVSPTSAPNTSTPRCNEISMAVRLG